MPVRLIDSLASTEPLAEIFSDRSILQAMLDFEIALARVESRLGIIPAGRSQTLSQPSPIQKHSIWRLSLVNTVARRDSRHPVVKSAHRAVNPKIRLPPDLFIMARPVRMCRTPR